MDEALTIDIGDLDMLKASSSRLRLGSTMTRREMLRLALMSSENRAASCLARNYPGGTTAFVEAMNRKAASLGMLHTHFSDATGLSSENVATARDLARMVQAAADYPLIREFTTTASHYVEMQPSGRVLGFNNTNSLVRGGAVGHHAEQDRVHSRGRQMPGHARQYRQPAGRHRAARFVRQAFAHRRCAARQVLARNRRIAGRCRPLRASRASRSAASHRVRGSFTAVSTTDKAKARHL